jgi:hypothetical protein
MTCNKNDIVMGGCGASFLPLSAPRISHTLSTHRHDIFWSVSHIIAYGSEHLLKRKPDGILPNGLNVVKFQAMHEFHNPHSTSKSEINEFVRGDFYGHYDFDLDDTLYVIVRIHGIHSVADVHGRSIQVQTGTRM